MNKQDFLKIQTCVLKVNIHCEGCKHKVKKILQKIEGVYTTSIDSEQGKVTVTGNVDPATLIRKLEKSGKHAELWAGKPKGGGDGGGQNNYQNLLKNLHMENFKGGGGGGGKDSKSNKGGGHVQDQIKGGGGGGGGINNQQAMILQQMQQQIQQMNGSKQMVNPKDQKPVKPKIPEDEFDESDEDFDDEFDDEDDDEEGYDSEYDEEEDEMEHGHHMPNKNMAPNTKMGGKGHGGPMDAVMNDKKGGGGGDGKKGGGGGGGVDLPMVMKSKGGDMDWDGGNMGGKKAGGGKEKDKSGKSGLFGLGGLLGASNKKSKDGKDGKGFKDDNNDDWGKKGGGGGKKEGAHHDNNKMKNEFQDNNIDVTAKHSKGGGGGGGGKGGKHSMDQMSGGYPMGESIPAVQGLPAGAMNGGYYQGNPYSQQQLQQQQYMAMMMNQQQQRPYGNDMYQPMMYSRPQPSVSYGPPMPPPVPVDPYSTYFSDENTNSCSIM